MKVLIIPEVRQYFYDLQLIMFEKDYFSYYEDAEEYVEELVADIKKNLPQKQSKPAPKHFDMYGKDMEYAAFKKNKNTTWYVFFDVYKDGTEIIYLVRHVENNHTAAHLLYKGF